MKRKGRYIIDFKCFKDFDLEIWFVKNLVECVMKYVVKYLLVVDLVIIGNNMRRFRVRKMDFKG